MHDEGLTLASQTLLMVDDKLKCDGWKFSRAEMRWVHAATGLRLSWLMRGCHFRVLTDSGDVVENIGTLKRDAERAAAEVCVQVAAVVERQTASAATQAVREEEP